MGKKLTDRENGVMIAGGRVGRGAINGDGRRLTRCSEHIIQYTGDVL